MRGVSRDDARGMRWKVFCFARPIRSLVSASRVERRRRRPFRRRGGHVDFGGDRPGRRLDRRRGRRRGDATGSIEDASGARWGGDAREERW